jgi:hypothetical protein
MTPIGRALAALFGLVGALAAVVAAMLLLMWITDSTGHGEVAFLFPGALAAGVVSTACLFIRLAIRRQLAHRSDTSSSAPEQPGTSATE